MPVYPGALRVADDSPRAFGKRCAVRRDPRETAGSRSVSHSLRGNEVEAIGRYGSQKNPNAGNCTPYISFRKEENSYTGLQSVRWSYPVHCTARSAFGPAVRLLAGPVAPFRTIRSHRPERPAGSARLGRGRQACGPPGRRWEHCACLRRVRTDAHGSGSVANETCTSVKLHAQVLAFVVIFFDVATSIADRAI